MFSYFAILPKKSDHRKSSFELADKIVSFFPQYSVSVETAGMIILTSGLESGQFGLYRLSGNCGFAIGNVFQKTDEFQHNDPGALINKDESNKIYSTEGRHFIENYWGRYILFLISEHQKLFYIVRDPVGGIPGYYHETDDLIVFFSDMSDFSKLNLCELSYNKVHIVSFIKMPFFEYNDTGFNEIHKILPGQAIKLINGSMHKKQYWNPADFCDRMKGIDNHQAAYILKNTVESCVHAWSSKFERIAIRLSGGLDSSIVLGCLNTAPSKPSVIGLHYYSSASPDHDERRMARIAADGAGIPLVEKEDVAEDVDISIINQFRFLAEPYRCRTAMARSTYEKQFFEQNDIDAFFTGEGGDAIFYQSAIFGLSDYIYHYGLGKQILSQCYSHARLTGKTLWHSIGYAISEKVRLNQWDINEFFDSHIRELIPANVQKLADLNERCLHWFHCLSDLSMAKQQHVAGTKLINYYRWPIRDEDVFCNIDPLLSQPVIELAYSIPTFMFNWGGISRGLARRAFRGLVPDANILRQSKGGPDYFYHQLFQVNLEFIKDTYLDGMLINNGLLDRQVVEKALSSDLLYGSPLRHYLFEMLAAEKWMQHWKDYT